MIKLVCFDLDGVFFNKAHQGIIDTLCTKFNLDKERVTEIMFKLSVTEGGYNDLKLGKANSAEYWEWFFNKLDIAGKYNLSDYLNDLHSNYSINSEALSLIDTLHKQNIQTAICSNNFESNIIGLKQKFNLDNFFDIQVYSYEVGALKPNIKIFAALLSKSGVSASEVYYADDAEDKLAGAKQLGINTSVYTNFNNFKKDLNNLGVKL